MDKQIIEMKSGDNSILVCIDKENLKFYLEFKEGSLLVGDLQSIPDFMIHYNNIYFIDIDYMSKASRAIDEKTNTKIEVPQRAWDKLKQDALKFIAN